MHVGRYLGEVGDGRLGDRVDRRPVGCLAARPTFGVLGADRGGREPQQREPKVADLPVRPAAA